MNEALNINEIIKQSPHSIYLNGHNQIVCGISMIHFASHQFNSSYVIQNLNILKELCQLKKEEVPKNQTKIEGFALNGLIDSIKISICFENIAKSKLLVAGYIIHEIDKIKFPELAKKQKKEPIKINEIKKNWSEKNNNPSAVKALYGLRLKTINYSLILKNKKYNSRLNINDANLKHLIQLNDLRNELHFHNSLSFKLNNFSFVRYSELNDIVAINSNEFIKNLAKLINLKKENLTPKFTLK
ncbi:hypothetical protein IX49_07695 [Cellulophaga lytica]|nr:MULTISPECIES: hypothetical protein [Cellulophaga]AIM60413.1 hypothetical protein IX49_07695 [Cellulophaga lytica]